MKKNAWTLAETFVAMIIITLISGYCISTFKPNVQKSKYFMYAVISNLIKGNVALLDKFSSVTDIPSVGGINPKVSLTKVGNVLWSTKNAGDSGGPELPPSVKICTAGESCPDGGATKPTCWQGTTSTTCDAASSTGYSGCNRTVCNWYAANLICPHSGMSLPSYTQLVTLRSGDDYQDKQSAVDICSHHDGDSLNSYCGGNGECLGADNNFCAPHGIWGLKSTESFYYAQLSSTSTRLGVGEFSKQYAFSVRCVSDKDTLDPYCANLADTYSLAKPANCSVSAGKDDVNLEFPNGVTIKGIASPWVKPYSGADFEYKNILVDIDGTGGKNKLWADQFPLRIIGGEGRGAQGLVMLVDCSDEKVYNPSTSTLVNVASGSKNPYCPSSNGKNYTIDDEIVTYDIYRAINKEENAKATLVASGLSTFEADCRAYGSSQGYFSVAECDAAKIKISPQCATQDSCATCTANTCPEGSTDAATCKTLAAEKNPDDLTCVTLLHKPSGGTSIFLQTLIGDIEEL